MSGGAGVAERDALREALAHMLACLRCEGRLDLDGAREEIRCASCAAVYPVRDGIPVLTPDRVLGQESERAFRDRLAADHAVSGRAALLATVARHHCVPVMRRRAAAFASRFSDGDWLLDVGIGWGWHWLGHARGARVLGIDMSLGNLRLARRMLAGQTDRVVLVCADAAALPLRRGSVAGLWSVQVFQHMPDGVLERAKAELDRVLRDPFRMEISNLNPALLHRVVYRLTGRRLHRRGPIAEMELTRRSAREWTTLWGDFRPGRTRVRAGYSELFFHPELRLRPRVYPLWLERVIAGGAPPLAGLIARQIDMCVESGNGW